MPRAGIKEAHPAGIWSDLSVDGPVIGTLIVVLDKAKNLPNRKKIGKQDPYAVARLGKEAKRTDADVRGGQTPRWDKELRFPVRNSPDYKSLKITVFNDDKKTDLIGETTLKLDKILVKGGGTDDGWRGLKCKEKYAGEILVELTFWDMRPKETPPTERKRLEQDFGAREREREREKEAPRKVGGAREMVSSRDKTVKRRPLPSDPTRSSKEDINQPVPVPEKRTRRSRHSYHPGYENNQPHHQHLYPEPQHPQYRDPRGSSRNIAMAPDPSPVSMGIYDPYGDNQIPGGDMLGKFEDDDLHGQPPPPPPPTHRRHYDASPGHHSPNPSHPHQQTIHKRHKSQHQLKHYQSVPDWQYHQQQQQQQQQQLQQQQPHRHSSDPREREMHRSNSYDPRLPAQDQYGGSYPGPQTRYHGQDDYDEYVYSANAVASTANLRQERPLTYHEDSPGLSYGPAPSSSFENFGGEDGAPPPPPPPHGHSPAPMRFDEPNWGNHKPKTKEEEDLGLPSYEHSVQLAHRRSHSNMNAHALEARRPSVGIESSPSRNGMPIPPSLVPGIDPVVAEQMSGRIGNERRLSYVDMSNNGPLQIEGPQSHSQVIQHRSSQNYHRPQVEEVQDVQLYQPQLLPEDQVVGRPMTVKKSREQRTAPMVKPMPIHGERDDAVPAVGATANSVKRNSTLIIVAPDRKPVPPTEPVFEGLPFSPDSFDLINPGPNASLEAAINGLGPTYNTPQEAEDTARRWNADSKRRKLPSKMIVPGTNRVLDGTDVLPPESFAPEPERRGGRSPRPPPPVPAEYRRHITGRQRSPSPQPPRRGERLALTGPVPPPLPKKVSIRGPSPQPDRGEKERERAKLQKRLRNSQSMAILPSNSRNHGSSRDRYSVGPGAMVMYNPESERERQMERDRDSRALVPAKGNDRYGYNSDQPRGGRSQQRQPAPPLPAKVPIDTTGMSREDYLLSQEMSLISLGPSNGGRTRRGRY
ncbi:hypothetical protein L873DRAFT_1741769 [Choiromyces venosus 120613-1]|uniref:C2 domain-containing protein n=1 Tax=Choiromyces venosus 120613-1 TaxID=1336337 RepID=A0A3N4JHH4_9PEZI|nr:hypothetical protein L873DRAFT_1741769 [Choiromyces venosus 120613-1]